MFCVLRWKDVRTNQEMFRKRYLIIIIWFPLAAGVVSKIRKIRLNLFAEKLSCLMIGESEFSKLTAG